MQTTNIGLDNFSGKRLLILGGTMWRDEIRRIADRYGLILVVCGNNPNSSLVEIADEYYEIDNTDENKMYHFIMDKKIDGVYMGANDEVISHAISYVLKARLPCVYSEKTWNIINNKTEFKKVCAAYDLPTVNQYESTEAVDKFPVVVKPIDADGSKGFSVCHNKEELYSAIDKSLSFSPTGGYLIEDYVDNSGYIIFYTFIDGEPVFSGIADKYSVMLPNGTFLGKVWTWESGKKEEFLNTYDKRIRKMFSETGMKNGNLWMEVFDGEKGVFFNEGGYRYGGEMTMYPINYFYSVNQIERDMLFSLGCPSTDDSSLFDTINDNNKNSKKKYYCTYLILLQKGKIGNITGIDELLNNKSVLKVFFEKEVGDVCTDDLDLRIRGGYVHFVYEDKTELHEMIELINDTIQIVDVDGYDMIRRDDVTVMKKQLEGGLL